MGQPGYNVRYDLTVSGVEVRIAREGKPIDQTFSTTEKDTKERKSALHKFLESIGRSQVDAHMVCDAVEKARVFREFLETNSTRTRGESMKP